MTLRVDLHPSGDAENPNDAVAPTGREGAPRSVHIAIVWLHANQGTQQPSGSEPQHPTFATTIRCPLCPLCPLSGRISAKRQGEDFVSHDISMGRSGHVGTTSSRQAARAGRVGGGAPRHQDTTGTEGFAATRWPTADASASSRQVLQQHLGDAKTRPTSMTSRTRRPPSVEHDRRCGLGCRDLFGNGAGDPFGRRPRGPDRPPAAGEAPRVLLTYDRVGDPGRAVLGITGRQTLPGRTVMACLANRNGAPRASMASPSRCAATGLQKWITY